LVARKNTLGLVNAFARLPERLRASHRLVLTFSAGEGELADVKAYARGLGIESALLCTNEVSDDTLRLLYQRCAAFVLPSYYEGFGLPLLEAMTCGAAVVAGNNSSQIEVVGDAGLLANVGDPGDVAEKLARILDDPPLAESLRRRAASQASQFSWERAAQQAAGALADLERQRRNRPRRVATSRRDKPRLAFFSPLPPRKSGISEYSAFLVDELQSVYTIDLYHDGGYRPDLSWSRDEFECIDARLFPHYARVRDYHALVYQMGNSRYHGFLYDTMLHYPGVVTLHDFCLAGFYLQQGDKRGTDWDLIRHELFRWYPEDEEEIGSVLELASGNSETLAKECALRGWSLNLPVFEAARAVVVHSPWCLKRIRATHPEHAARTTVIPHGIWTRSMSPTERAAIRGRFNLRPDALIVASFGFIHPDKMLPQALEAFVEVARNDPSAMFVLVGEDADEGVTRRCAQNLGLNDRARFLGRQSWDDFVDLMAVADVGVNLRLPPTNGETSGALLNLLAAGVPTVVTEVATFADYPNDVVRKVAWERDGFEGLQRALLSLTGDAQERKRLGSAARTHVRQHQEWPRAAARYVEVIEQSRRTASNATRSRRVMPSDTGTKIRIA
jgi:glycosyltransferase involved in cell wall biosynthesis